MEWLLGFLPFLLFLACPLMMVFCIFGMRRAGCSTQTAPATTATTAMLDARPPAEQVMVLQARLDQLQTEQAAIAQQIAGLAAATAAETSQAPAAPLASDVFPAAPAAATSHA